MTGLRRLVIPHSEARLGMGIYISEYAKIGGYMTMAHDTEHFLSNASVGRDLDGSGLVEARGQPGTTAEHNPTFSAAIDQPGRRIQ